MGLQKKFFDQLPPFVDLEVNANRFGPLGMLGDNDFRAAFAEIFDNPD